MNSSKDVYKTKVDPNGGKLIVYAVGGRGGSGGSGACSHDKCYSTDGALGGDAGDGGDGGTVTFYILSDAMRFKNIIEGYTPGGSGGSGGSSCSCTGLSNTDTGGGARGQDRQAGYKGQEGSGVQFQALTHEPN